MKALLAWLSATLVLADVALAQRPLSSAPAQDSPAASDEATPKPARHRTHRKTVDAPALASEPATIEGRELRLNGRGGDLQLSAGDDKTLKITKFAMLGEVVSDPSKACRIDIVAEQPIEAVAKGAPDGLPRYSADIAACPLTFDIVDGAVLVPAQANACVFAAADCQASPSGLWGPQPAEIEKDPKAISKLRAAADRSIQDSLRDLEKRDANAAASLAREESDFASERDEVCQAYADESRLGFCASRLAQARAALLVKRVADAGPASDRSPSRHKRKK
jgi:hypothetical protein